MIQIGSKTWEVSVIPVGDGLWQFKCNDSTADIVAAFDGANTAVITSGGKVTTYFEPQLVSIRKDYIKDVAFVEFSVKDIPADVEVEINGNIDDANAALVELAEYCTQLEERIAALEGENNG